METEKKKGSQRKNRTDNDLFLGADLMSMDGHSVKHPAGIAYYANVNPFKTSDEPIELKGIDIETDAETGEFKLLGIFSKDKNALDYEGEYRWYTRDIFQYLLTWIKRACDRGFNFAHWNRLDPFQMYKLFLLADGRKDEVDRSLARFGKEGGDWNRKEGRWDVEPVIKLDNGLIEFGIKTVIRSSIQFFYRHLDSHKVKTCWAYDIAGFYDGSIEAEGDYSKGGRFKWYSKVGKQYHIVDWSKFNIDKEYRDTVLYSNELDARCAMGLGYRLQEDFYSAFKVYPRSLVSTGSFARSAISAIIDKTIAKENLPEKEHNSKLYEDVHSIGIKSHLDRWVDTFGQEIVKDFYAMACESYSGGYIEAIRYGTAKEGYTADLASAYPAYIEGLEDLRGAEIIKGYGEPPKPKTGYVFIRGTVNMPESVNYHTITIRSPINTQSNVRPTGIFRASYTWDEREFAKEQGATFEDEVWYHIKTTGELSVLANVTKQFIQLRKDLKSKGDSAEYMAKIAVNSEYGILFEAVDTFNVQNGEAIKAGYRAGEFWNPVYASIITGRVRIALAKASMLIEQNGGKPIVLMTDSVTWTGLKSHLPDKIELPWGETGIKKVKTLGYFEEPIEVKDIVCLGSGRYGFKTYNPKKGEWEIVTKKRGLNITEVVNNDSKDGVVEEMKFNWHEVLEEMRNNQSIEVAVKVRTLISPAMVRTRHEYGVKDIGRLIDDERTIQAVVGKSKRLFDDDMEDPETLSTQLVETEPYRYGIGFDGTEGPVDGSYPNLRKHIMLKDMKTSKERERITTKKRVRRFRKNHRDELNEEARDKYQYSVEEGFSVKTAKKMSRWSWDKIKEHIQTQGGRRVIKSDDSHTSPN